MDTGFLVFNERTYPTLIGLFAELGIQTAASDMSFSVQARSDALEWSGSDPGLGVRAAPQPAASGVLAHALATAAPSTA